MFGVSMPTLFTRLRLTLRPVAPTADADLLARFVEHHDQDAFAEVVRRHGPMVYGVCRRALGDGPDAEDAYQAVFVVLARRAAAVARMAGTTGWLYGVACLTARKARARRAKRRSKEGGELADVPAPQPTVEPDLGTTIDEELANVPEKFRTAVVLCELRQQTLDEAAAELGVPRGTVASRLARGRELLGKRLLRRGLFAAGAGAASAVTARPPLELDLRAVEQSTNPDALSDLSSEVLRAMNGSTRRNWYLGLIAVAAVVGVPLVVPATHAAPTPKAEAKEKGTLDRVRLNRLGGLLDQPAVKKAIELTDEQEGRLKAIEKDIMSQLKPFAQQPRGALGREQTNEKMNEVLGKYDEKAVEVLTAEQLRRLKQIQLQREEPGSLLGRFAVRELALTPEQEDKIADAIAPLLRAKPFANLASKFAARNPQEAAEIDAVLAGRAELTEKLRTEAVKHLTDGQKKKWKGMTGEPIPAVELAAAATEEFFFRLYIESLK
jgi:RNA polymerase sigma-70 factor (ECF subfamily)